jgi:osmotically-inducible protein OsmY
MKGNDNLSHADAEIARAVRRALERDVPAPDAQIQSTVCDGWVTLEGAIETYSQREEVVRAVRSLAGVIGVHNWIVVELPLVEPGEVREVIEAAFERRADRLADRIKISVDDGQVTLGGTVRSVAEKQAVLGAVGHMRGVFSLRDQLLVQRDD